MSRNFPAGGTVISLNSNLLPAFGVDCRELRSAQVQETLTLFAPLLVAKNGPTPFWPKDKKEEAQIQMYLSIVDEEVRRGGKAQCHSI